MDLLCCVHRRLLNLVGIEFLVEREGSDEASGWDVEKVWEDTLSLGEQQRLGMARMYFNAGQARALDGRPKFAVLGPLASNLPPTCRLHLT